MKKGLVLLPNLRVCNGVAAYIMNYYRHIDHNIIQMDFVTLSDVPSPYIEEIIQLGGQVFSMPSPKNFFSYCKCIRKIYTENQYDVLHCNVTNAALPYLYYAKKVGIQKRILHSHATQSAEKKWKKIRNDTLGVFAMHYANTYFACSKLAGDYLFKGTKYIVVNNAIQIEKYVYNESKRGALREVLNIKNAFVVGTVGRLASQKNPFFAMDVFKLVLEHDPTAIYLWIGSGPLDDEIRAYTTKIGIQNSVQFLGSRSDVNELYNVMDVFFLPSLYEGLPVVGVEAQANGLPGVVADSITKEMKVCDNMAFYSLSMPKEQWAVELLKRKNEKRMNAAQQIKESGFDICKEAENLMIQYS